MYLNTVTLTGFMGGDAESRTTRSKAAFVTFSLATKNSWKDRDTGEWNSHTEWHRAIVFGRLATFAATLLKGDHVQIQGQLRTREFDKGDKNGTGKQRVTEIHVTSIFKLDRSATEKAAEPPARRRPNISFYRCFHCRARARRRARTPGEPSRRKTRRKIVPIPHNQSTYSHRLPRSGR